MNTLQSLISSVNGTAGVAKAQAPTSGRDLIRTVTVADSFGVGARNGWGATGSAWKGMSDGQIDFPVAQRKLFAAGKASPIDCPEHKAIIREYRGAAIVLGIVGTGYKMLKTGDAVESMIAALDRSLPVAAFEGAIRRNLIAYKGAMTACEIVLPALGGEVQTASGFRSNVAFRVILRNTYDASGSVRLLSGMIDFFCTNGCVSGDLDVGAFRHTSGLSVEKLVAQVEKSTTRFAKDLQRIRIWAQNSVDLAEVAKAIRALPGISDRKASVLLDAFDRETAVRGANFWSVMSALTADATHGSLRETGSDHAAATILDRQMQAARWTDQLAAELVH